MDTIGRRSLLSAAGAMVLTAGAHVSAAQAGSVTPISRGTSYWTYNGYGSGQLGSWNLLGRSTSSDAVFANARSGVWVYGDSIMRADYANLAAGLAGKGVASALDAQAGLPTVPAVDRLAARVARQGSPRVLLMATGSNDIFNPSYIASQTARVRSLVGLRTTVVWVNVYVRRVSVSATTREYDMRNSRTVNAAIAAGPVDRVVDWYGYLSAKPSRPTAYLRDGVHTTISGQAARNALILAKVVP